VQEKGYKTEAETGGGTYIWNRGKGKWEIKKGAYWDNPGFNQIDRHPVTCVSWNDAQAFIKWLNKKTGSSYRLPSEAEWEYAARAGTKTARFWGDDPNDACSYANVADQTKSPDGKFQWSDIHECTDGYWFTAPVGSFRSNAFGLYDMLGNVSEWCQDVYGNYTAGSLIDPQAFVPSGIGVKLKLQDGIITIVELSKGQPAEQAGLRPGDTIMQINDKITKNMKVAEAVSLIGGANGTMVTLTIIHEGEKEPKKFTLTREPLEIGVLRVLRGGSWENVARLLRAAYRVEFIPDVRTNSFGFRVARDLY
jgi:formylglycine-generating enzyme required for sulfatase activity